MQIPCFCRPAFILSGFAFLKPELTSAQFNNFTMIATALILGSKFNLTRISLMWLHERSVSTLSEFLSDGKFSTTEMQRLHLLNLCDTYKVEDGYFLIDDTMQHHTKFCKWIHGVQCLFDHALGTNLKAKCIVFLYYSNGGAIKFPITHRIFYQKKAPFPGDGEKISTTKRKMNLPSKC